MGFIAAGDPVSKQSYVFTDVGQLHNAIKTEGYVPLRPDNQPYRVQEFQGGYLLDGAPLNVYILGQWFDGQMQQLMPFWESGQIPKPTAETLNVGTVQMPEDVRTNYEAGQVADSLFGLGIPTPVLIGGAALVYFLFLRR